MVRGCRRRRLLAGAAIDIDDLAALLPGRVFGLLRLGLLGRALAAVFRGARGATGCRWGSADAFWLSPPSSGAAGCDFGFEAASASLPAPRCATLVERQHELPDLDLVPRLDLDLARPCRRRWTGTSIVALSVSSSSTGWSFFSASPALTRTRTTSPALTFSPSSGILNSATPLVAPELQLCLRGLSSRD